MEIEAKFQVPDQQALDALASTTELAGLPLSSPVKRNMRDTYLDTPGRLFAAAGYTCRRRVVGRKTVITLKELVVATEELHRREEHEVEVRGAVPWAEWPEGPVRELVAVIAGDEPLEEVMCLRQTRLMRRVGPPRHGVAEMSLDRVEMSACGQMETTEALPTEKAVFYEVEVELKPSGSEEQLASLAAALRDEWHLTPQPLPKFEQALAVFREAGLMPTPAALAEDVAEPAAPPEEAAPKSEGAAEKRPKGKRFLGDGLPVLKKPGLTADDTMAEAATKTLLYHLQQMMRHEPGTRTGEDPEELHDMRVATRRMRAAVRVFGDYVDRGSLKPYLKMMRQTGRELGAVRDLDVFRIKIQTYIDSLPPARQNEMDPLLEAWERERDRARAELVDFLDQERYQAFKEKFESFLRSSRLEGRAGFNSDGEPVATKVRDILPGIIFERLAAVRAYDEEMMSGTAPVVRYHQLRIAMKSLRYTLEYFQEVLGPKAKPLIDVTKQVQDHLGDLQDASVTCEVVLGFLASGEWGPGRGKMPRSLPVNAPGVARYLAVKQREIERAMRTFRPVWRRIRGPQFSRRIAALVGAL